MTRSDGGRAVVSEFTDTDEATAPQSHPDVPQGLPTLETIEQLPEILTRRQAAWLLQVSGQHLQDSARRGDIPSTLLGSTRRFSKSALLRAVRGETET